METQEKWLPVKGYEGFYEISDHGKVRSVKRRGYIMSPYKNNGGYLCIRLSKDNKKKSFTVHRLVAEAFIPNPENLPQINHKNENKTYNLVENLEWCDCRYNLMYGSLPEKRKKLYGQAVCMYDKHGRFLKTFRSAREAERQLGVSHNSILKCCKGESYFAGSFLWRFEKETKRDNIIPKFYKNAPREVDQYDKNLNLIATHESIHAAARAIGGKAENIGFACRTSGHTASGFYWVFHGTKPTKKITKKIRKYDLRMNYIDTYANLNDASISVGGKSKKAGIKQCLYGKNKQAYGYIWKYCDHTI